MRLVVVSFVVLFATACDQSPEQRAADVCTAMCDCNSASPANVNACIDECVQLLPPPSDECLQCAYQYSQTCGTLVDQCIALCFPQQPQP